MATLFNALLVTVLMLNLFMLGTSRIQSVIRTVALQGILVGILPLLIHEHLTRAALIGGGAAILTKGLVIPFMLSRALREVHIKREVEPLIGMMPSIILGAVATGIALIFASKAPLADAHTSRLIVPSSAATIAIGFILLVSRFKAISQVIGYLVLENGIFIFGLLLIGAMPLVVEMGVLLDVFVGIFVSCIIISKIHQSFSSMDTRVLSSLKG